MWKVSKNCRGHLRVLPRQQHGGSPGVRKTAEFLLIYELLLPENIIIMTVSKGKMERERYRHSYSILPDRQEAISWDIRILVVGWSKDPHISRWLANQAWISLQQRGYIGCSHSHRKRQTPLWQLHVHKSINSSPDQTCLNVVYTCTCKTIQHPPKCIHGSCLRAVTSTPAYDSVASSTVHKR